MSDRVADLVVIGAGPAGCILALSLARSGYDVVLCEQHRIPHDKLCGEFLSGQAVARLREVGLADGLVRDFAPPIIDHLRFVVPGERELVHPLAPPAIGLSRLRLDATLAAACVEAGVEVRSRWRAARVRADQAGFVVDGVASAGGEERQHLRARVVAGAFGKEERLMDGRGSENEPPLEFIACKAHHLGEPPRGAVELFAFPGGYCGVAAIEGGRVNVCALATRASFRRAGATIEGLLAEASRQNSALAERLSRLEPVGSSFLTAGGMRFRRRLPVSRSLLHLGDAAAMIAPLCGDGIGIALSSAALARHWVARRLEGRVGHEAMLAGYARSWRSAFLRPLARGDALQQLLLAPRAAAWTVRVCRAWPAITAWLVRGTREVPVAP